MSEPFQFGGAFDIVGEVTQTKTEIQLLGVSSQHSMFPRRRY